MNKAAILNLPRSPIGRSTLNDLTLSSAFQPIFSPTHQRLVGFEALLRAHCDSQPVSPLEALDRAEAENRVEQFDEELLNLHLQQFSGCPAPAWLFLNISPATCIQGDIALEHLADICEQVAMAPAQVVLEVVETATDNKSALLNFVQKAKVRGFRIAIDDFGTGDSNFERIWQLEPMIVKIDRSLLVNAGTHRRARQLLDSLVAMIRESGSLVLIEGVETMADAHIALASGADLLQGFLFGRPAPLTGAPETPEWTFARQIRQIKNEQEQHNEAHQMYLSGLREAVKTACHRFNGRHSLVTVCRDLLRLEGVKRCFILDNNGVQQGGLVSDTAAGESKLFNPLYQSSGAQWAHRDYFQRALANPCEVNASRPYVALPDAIRTVTLSYQMPEAQGEQVLCVDVHPDALFQGRMTFPDVL